MAVIQNEYKYSIEASYIDGNEETPIESEAIKQIIIDYDYTGSNTSPIVIMEANIGIVLYNKMVLNSGINKILLIISKFKSTDSNKAKKVYIKKQLTYFMSNTDYDYDGSIVDEPSQEVSYRRVMLGLVDIDLVNKEKMIINKMFKNTNPMSMVYFFLQDRKIILEPFEHNESQSLFTIMPIEGISKMLNYVNDMITFYDSGFIYFQDFKYTYLLSKNGKPISINDGTYDTVKVDIQKLNMKDSYNGSSILGQLEDSDKKIYSIEVNSNQYNINPNTVTDKIYNMIYGVDSNGTVKKKSFDVNKTSDSKVKPKIVRIPNNNNNYIKNIASMYETSETVINISKTDIDASIIVPYKEFIVENMKVYKKENGNYFLSRKVEVYAKYEEDFACSVTFTLQKVQS